MLVIALNYTASYHRLLSRVIFHVICCGRNLILQACCHQPHANRLSQLVRAPTARGETVKQPHDWRCWRLTGRSSTGWTSSGALRVFSLCDAGETMQIVGGFFGGERHYRAWCAQSHTSLFPACILPFSRIFLLYPHMFSRRRLSSLGLYAIMLLGNCRRKIRSVGCVRVRPVWCVFTSAVREAVQYMTCFAPTGCTGVSWRLLTSPDVRII